MTVQPNTPTITRKTCVGLYRFNAANLSTGAKELYFNYVEEFSANNDWTWGQLLIAIQDLYFAAKRDWAEYEADMKRERAMLARYEESRDQYYYVSEIEDVLNVI